MDLPKLRENLPETIIMATKAAIEVNYQIEISGL